MAIKGIAVLLGLAVCAHTATLREQLDSRCPYTNPSDDVLLPAEDCQHFYKCDHGIPVLQSCPEGLDWSQNLHRCDWPEVAQCLGRNFKESIVTRIEPSTPKPVSVFVSLPELMICPAENGPQDVLYAAEDCQHFYKCNRGALVLISCPVGQEWAQHLRRCDWPEVAQCSTHSITQTSTDTSVISPQPSIIAKPVSNSCPVENGTEDVLFPAEDCQHFYKCDHGVPVLQDCPVELDWSQSLLRCDWPEVAQCVAK